MQALYVQYFTKYKWVSTEVQEHRSIVWDTRMIPPFVFIVSCHLFSPLILSFLPFLLSISPHSFHFLSCYCFFLLFWISLFLISRCIIEFVSFLFSFYFFFQLLSRHGLSLERQIRDAIRHMWHSYVAPHPLPIPSRYFLSESLQKFSILLTWSTSEHHARLSQSHISKSRTSLLFE